MALWRRRLQAADEASRNDPDTPSSSEDSFSQEGTVRTKKTKAPKSTKTASAPTVRFYMPEDDTGEYHHIATELKVNPKRNDDTPCIVQNVNRENDYRIWCLKQVRQLSAKDHTQTFKYKSSKQGEKFIPYIERQFHSSDSEGIAALGRLKPEEFSVIATLTWRVKRTNEEHKKHTKHKKHKKPKKHEKHEQAEIEDEYKYYNTVLFNVTNDEKRQRLISSRKMHDYKYEGPFQCSITKFRQLADGQKALDKLQLDTEAGEGYSRYWQRYQEHLKNEKDLQAKSRAKSRARSSTPAETEVLESLAKLKVEYNELQEEHEKLKRKHREKRNEEWSKVLSKSGMSTS